MNQKTASTHKKYSPKSGWLQTILKRPILWLFAFLYRPKVEGKENIPKTGRIIMTANHKHVFDQFPVMMGAKKRKMHFIAKAEYADKFIGWFMSAFGVIFVDRNTKDKADLYSGIKNYLEQERAVALFPEGTRNKTDQITIDFKFGAVKFARDHRAPIIPAAIIGEYKIFPKKSTLKIIFGKPITVKPTDDLEKVNKKLRKTIENLLKDNGEDKYRPKIHASYKKKGMA